MANGLDPRATVRPQPVPAGVGRDSVAVDAGLRSYMLSVYNYMGSGVLLTGIVALLFARSGAAETILFGPGILKYLIMFSPLAFVMVLSFGINRLSTGTAQLLFWGFATVMGLSMASIFFRFTGPSIALTFFATSAAFLSLSLWGYTTKKDLSGFGTFMIMGVVGLFVAMLLNLWFQSPAMTLAISAIGVLLFAGLTAYDTQRIKDDYYAFAGDATMAAKASIFGALSLYQDFVGLFMNLLTLLGDRE